MEWRKIGRGLALTGGTSLAAAAAFNALATHGVKPLDNPLGGEEGWFRWRGRDVAFTRRGSGSPVLLLHALHAGASSYEWRFNADALAARHTVYTLDLLGFGRSERPAIRYSAGLYVQLVADFVSRIVQQPCALVGSALSAAYAIELGARNPQRYPALVLVGPTGVVPPEPAARDAGALLMRSPVVGTAVYHAQVTRQALRDALSSMYARPSLVTAEMLNAHFAAAHQPGARYAVAALRAGQLQVDVRAALRRLVQPALLVWGRQAEGEPVERAHNFRALKPDLQLEVLDPAGDRPHEEQPDRFDELALRFLDSRGGLRVVA